MSDWEIKGWCPGALRPMRSGDGLVTRIRPPLGRLSATQAQAIALAAQSYGNGVIDLSARANLQIRGVRDATFSLLIDALRQYGLIDSDIETESLRNLIITPFGDDETSAIASTLASSLSLMPPLPGKFGFAVDTGPCPVLSEASADMRIERADNGCLILRPDGHRLGRPLTDLVADTIAMAEWFVANGGVSNGRGRMAALLAKGSVPPECIVPRAKPLPKPQPGLLAEGALVALAFGQMSAETLVDLAALGHEIRPTPWRMLLLAGATSLPSIPGLITDPKDPLLRVTACTGAPECSQAKGETRRLARQLAALLPEDQRLHVSGCAKGCAHPHPSGLTLTATPDGYDLIRNGKAADTPILSGLTPKSIQDHLKARHAPQL